MWGRWEGGGGELGGRGRRREEEGGGGEEEGKRWGEVGRREGTDIPCTHYHDKRFTLLQQGTIRDYEAEGRKLDLALGLHVCGEASDHIIMAAVGRGVPWILSPCCLGAVNKRADSGGYLAEIRLPAHYAVEKCSEGGAAAVIVPLGEVDGGPPPRRVASGPGGTLLNGGPPSLVFGVQQVLSCGSMGPIVVSFSQKTGTYVCTNTKYSSNPTLDVPVVQHLLHGVGGASFERSNVVALLARSAPRLERPRSRWFSEQLSGAEFSELACLADVGHVAPADTPWSADMVAYQAKTVVTLDRAMWAQERGYAVICTTINRMGQYAKDDLVWGTARKLCYV